MVEEELRLLLQSYPNVEIVDRAQDGQEAVSKVAKLQPTVVVMDVNLPKMDGIAATREIKTKYPNIVVIGLTVSTEDYVLYAMLKAGASEVLRKENVVNDLYRAIQRAVASVHPIVILEEDQATENTSPRTEGTTSSGIVDAIPPAETKANLDPQ